MYLRNCWYVAAWDREVTRRPLARMILGEPIVLYRGAGGAPVALEDRCCHRHLPLSMGEVEGDTLRCHYHGLRFAPSGACVEIPGQDRVPADARIHTARLHGRPSETVGIPAHGKAEPPHLPESSGAAATRGSGAPSLDRAEPAIWSRLGAKAG